MPYYYFSVGLKTGVPIQFVRQLDIKDIDQVWRIYEKKAKDHYKRQMISFKVIQLSKLDPVVKEWITAQGKTSSATGSIMDELLNTTDYETLSTNRKEGRSQGLNLKERKPPNLQHPPTNPPTEQK